METIHQTFHLRLIHEFHYLYRKNNLLTYGWSSKNEKFFISEIDCEIENKKNVIFFDFFTIENFRKKGFYKVLLKKMMYNFKSNDWSKERYNKNELWNSNGQYYPTGILSSYKSVHISNFNIAFDKLTNKDKKDIKTAVRLGCNWIALSYLQNEKLIYQTRKLIKKDIGIISKIENKHALNNINEIIKATDIIMIAR